MSVASIDFLWLLSEQEDLENSPLHTSNMVWLITNTSGCMSKMIILCGCAGSALRQPREASKQSRAAAPSVDMEMTQYAGTNS